MHALRKHMLPDPAVLVERTHNHVLGGNIDGMYREFRFEARQERGWKKYIFSVRLPTLCLHGEGSEERSDVSG